MNIGNSGNIKIDKINNTFSRISTMQKRINPLLGLPAYT
jgi:hypothetical protein